MPNRSELRRAVLLEPRARAGGERRRRGLRAACEKEGVCKGRAVRYYWALQRASELASYQDNDTCMRPSKNWDLETKKHISCDVSGRSKMSTRARNESESRSPIVVREVQNPGIISEIAFSGDGYHILMGARNLAVRVWSVCSGGVELVAPPLVS